jgi:hypothetical protein
MQGTVSSLLILTSAVILTCVVIGYAVTVVEQTLQTTNIPQLDRLKDIQRSLLNETDSLFNQTQMPPADPTQP